MRLRYAVKSQKQNKDEVTTYESKDIDNSNSPQVKRVPEIDANWVGISDVTAMENSEMISKWGGQKYKDKNEHKRSKSCTFVKC